jgi:cytochrome c
MKKLVLIVALCLMISGTAFAFTNQQVQRGKQLYATQCAVCHGIKGQGGRVPAAFPGIGGMSSPNLMGSGALDTMRNALNYYSFIKVTMPLQKPGSLSEKDYLDIIAYNLEQNKVAKPDQTPLTVKNAAKVKITGN